MSDTRKRTGRREKSCRRCFTYIPADSRKCKFCGYVYKSSGKYLIDKFKQAFNIDRAYSVDKSRLPDARKGLFTAPEIENLLDAKNYRIMMYLVLDDVAFLDEMALIELGRTLTQINEG